MYYPQVSKTTRIKKYPSMCIIQDEISGESIPCLPVQAAILSLCQGVLTIEEIIQSISDIYKCSFDQASWLVNDIIKRGEKHLLLPGSQEPIETTLRLSPLDYVYKQKIEKRNDYALPEPYEAILLISERCNLRCKYCFRGGGHQTKDLSTEDWIKIIRDLGSLNIMRCMVSGGEPTLHRGIVHILDSLIENKIFPYLATNGTQLSQTMVADFKYIGLQYIQVSLDTVNNNLFHKITGVNCLDSVLNGIKLLHKAGIVVAVKAVITKHTASDIDSLIDVCSNIGVSKLNFDQYSPSAMGKKEDDLFLSQNQYEELINTIQEQQSKYRGIIEIGRYKKIDRWNDAKSIVPCGAFLGSLTINSQGEIIVCDQFDHRKMRPGNVLDNSIMQVWDSERMKEIRTLKNVSIDSTCTNCENFPKCKTGCFSISELYTGNPFMPDPRCWKAEQKGPDEVYE